MINFRATSKTWTLKNLDPEKHGINMGLKNRSAFREFSEMHNVICSLEVCVLTLISKLNLSSKNCYAQL